MQYNQKQFTQKGLNMFSNALANKQSITVDKVIVDDLPTNNFSNLALLSLDSFADAMSFQANYTETSNNTLTVDAVMSNKGFTSSYTINELGLVGHIGDDVNNQSLMAVLVASDPFTLPAQQNNETPSQFIPNITIQLANDDMGQVPVMVSNDAYIAQKDLDKLVSDNGYIKLNDADNRYVKQTDFNNEVNGAVNEKADKIYVDQNISQTNSEVSNKANKNDLSNLQNNINNDIQPKLNSKANQSDLNTTNSNVSSLQSNKADKGDVNGQINQVLSQSTSHSDQNYSDLNDKNNILSNRLEDYQKPNLVDAPNIERHTYGWNSNTGNGIPIQVEKGKTYYISILNQGFQGGQVQLMSGNNGIYSSDEKIPIAQTKWTSGKDYTVTGGTWTSDRNALMYIYFQSVNGADVIYKNACVTETSTYVPFSVAQQNKASIQSEDQFTTDYQAPNLSPISDCTVNGWMYKYDNGYAPITIQVEKGKTYFFSMYVETANANVIFPDISTNASDYKDINGNTFAFAGNYYISKWTSDRDGALNVDFCTGLSTVKKIVSKICITQSDNYVPYEIANRDRILEHAVTNKTNDLSQQIQNSHTDLNNAKADKVNVYSKSDIDSKIDGSVDNAINQANQNTNEVSNKIDNLKNSYFGEGKISNGNNLDGYNWNGSFVLTAVNLATLGGNTGLPQSYSGFYGVLKVDTYSGFARQFLYDNIGNQWYRYLGNGSTWKQIPTEDDIASIKKNSWRELTAIDGGHGLAICKPNFSTNEAIVVSYNGGGKAGNMAFENEANDFDFVKEEIDTTDNYGYTIMNGNKIGRTTHIAAGYGDSIAIKSTKFKIQPK